MVLDFSLTPTTELEAVNLILFSISESPVSSLAGTLPADAAMARSFLHRESRTVQGQGCSFNTDYDYSLAPTSTGEIPIPPSALRVDPSDPHSDVVVRAGKLYDRSTFSFIFTDPVKVDVIWFFAFDDLPEEARAYITMRAVRRFQDRMGDTDRTLHSISASDELEAKTNFMNAEAQADDLNVSRHSPTASRILRRRPLR